MEITVQNRKYRIRFKYDTVYAAKRKCGLLKSGCHGGKFKYLERETLKQPLEFIPVPDPTPITRELTKKFGKSVDFFVDLLEHIVIDIRRRVTCYIEDITNITDPKKFPRVQGEAICNPRDNFTKEKGRKIALTKALQNCYVFIQYSKYMHPDHVIIRAKKKQFRTEFWREYFRLKKEKK